MQENKICVTMLLDKDTKETLEKLQTKLGRPFPSGHITIATYGNIDPELVLKHTEEMCRTHSTIDVEYTGMGIMTGEGAFIYAIPRVTRELMDMHRDFHQKYDDKCTDFHTSLEPFDWIPHTSLAAYTDEALKICLENFKNLHGKIVGMRVVDVLDDYKTLGVFDLMKNEEF